MSSASVVEPPYTGKPLNRVDGFTKVTGQAKYCGDLSAPDAVHAVLVQSTVACGSINRMDVKQASSAPGVLLVLTHENCPALHPLPEEFVSSFPGERRTPLADNEIHYAGQHIAVVAAATLEQAEDAASLVRVEYNRKKPILTPLDNLTNSYQPDHFAKNEEEKLQVLRGDPKSLTSTVKVEQTYQTPVLHHNPIEPSATVASWTDENQLTLFDSTRWLDGSRMFVAHMLGLPESSVRVVCPLLGGAFGSKGFLWQHVVLAAVAAKMMKRPVKLVLSREQMFTSVGHRPQTTQQLSLSTGSNGQLAAVEHHVINETSPIAHFVEPAGTMSRNLYHCENVAISHRVAATNIATPCFMRAPGEAPGLFALEAAMDELAYKLNMDPLALRLQNYAETDLQLKKPWSSKHLRECYGQGAEMFGWHKRSAAPGSMRRNNHLVGWGMATAAYPARRMAATVQAVLSKEGKAVFSTASHEIGGGVSTIMSQLAADVLDIPIEQIVFRLGDSAFPQAPVAGASQTSASVGPAVQQAAALLREKLIRLAIADSVSPLYEAAPDSIELQNGQLQLKSDPTRQEHYTVVLSRMQAPQLQAEAKTEQGKEKEQFTFESFGAHFAEVLVDPQLGHIQVSRWVAVLNGGKILNTKTARSQVLGGIIFGLGMTLREQTIYDGRTGLPVNPNLAEYLLPVNADIPNIDVSFVDVPDTRFNSTGARGIGELGLTGVPAAIANAVYHATGKRFYELPITPDKVMA